MTPGRSGSAIEPLEPRRLLSSSGGSAGTPDPVFGPDGVHDIDFPGADGSLQFIGEQPGGGDSKLLARGLVDNNVVVTRLLANGAVDPTFGVGGYVPLSRDIERVVIDPESGRFVVVHTYALDADTGEPKPHVRLVGFTAEGRYDPTFGVDGVSDIPFTIWDLRIAYCGGGRLLLGGNDFVPSADPDNIPGDIVIELTRLRADGSVDPTFGDASEHVVHISPADAAPGTTTVLGAIAVAPADGGIILGAETGQTPLNSDEGAATRAELFRLTADGAPDARFSDDGFLSLHADETFTESRVDALIVDPADGAVHVLWGYVTAGATYTRVERQGYQVASVRPDGTPGDGFSGALPLPEDVFRLPDFGVDPAGRIIVAGGANPTGESYSGQSAQQAFAAAVRADGTLDPAWGDGGLYRSPLPVIDEAGYVSEGFSFGNDQESFIYPDGRVLFGGRRVEAGISGDFELIRLRGDANSAPAITLTQRGTLAVQTGDGDDVLSVGMRHRDGRLVVRSTGGYARSFAPSRVRHIALYTCGGDDVVTLGTDCRAAYVDGGAGNDSINGGSGDDVLVGGAGADQMYGGEGADRCDDDASDVHEDELANDWTIAPSPEESSPSQTQSEPPATENPPPPAPPAPDPLEGMPDAVFGAAGVSDALPAITVRDLRRLPDGRLLVITDGGDFYRFNADGTLDAAYNPPGDSAEIPGDDDDGSGGAGGAGGAGYGQELPDRSDGLVALDPTGARIAVPLGGSGGADDAHVFTLVRTADHQTDLSFNGDGATAGRRVAFQGDGKLLVADKVFHDPLGENYDWDDVRLTRYNTNGTRDLSFGGQLAQVVLTDADDVDDLESLPDGRIAVASRSIRQILNPGGNFSGDDQYQTVTVLTADGRVEWSTDAVRFPLTSDGSITKVFGGDVEPGPDGSILLLGRREHDNPEREEFVPWLTRFTADGRKVFDVQLEEPTLESAERLTVDRFGRAWVLGWSAPTDELSPARSVHLARYNADGSPDTTWGGGSGDLVFEQPFPEIVSPGERVGGRNISVPPRGLAMVLAGERVIVAAQEVVDTTDPERWWDPAVRTSNAKLLGVRSAGADSLAKFGVTSDGTLAIDTASDAADDVAVTYRARDNRLIARAGDVVRVFAASHVKAIQIFTHGGADTITLGDGIPARGYVDAGAGDDVATLNPDDTVVNVETRLVPLSLAGRGVG